MIKINCLIPLFLIVMMSGCGGGSSNSSDDSSLEMPVDVSIDNAVLTGSIPATFTFNVPAPTEPLTEVTIDLVKTLEAATITVTPTP